MVNRTKRLAVLGSTGSIGQQTLEVVRKFPGVFEVMGLACNSNIDLFRQQVDEFKPPLVCTSSTPTRFAAASTSLEEIAVCREVDIVVIATTGKAGLGPAISAIKAGKKVALANKEILVMAGDIITRMAARHGASILPIDSEHSAIWQCLQGEAGRKISRLLLTASGGPFFGMSRAKLATVSVDDALNHPTWKMGKKVTIDSATLFNKGLEAIEAHWLFKIPYRKIEILIHRQSIVHSMVEFSDGSVKAQMSTPDMRLPIQYALFYPDRVANNDLTPLNFSGPMNLSFEPVKLNDFPCLKIAFEAARKGDTYPAVICAADEVAVHLFIRRQIKFTDIATIIEKTMNMHKPVSNPRIEDILNSDEWARKTARNIARKAS